MYFAGELEEEGTFVRNGDVLATTLKFTVGLQEITVTKDGKLSHENGNNPATYAKVKK